MLLGFRHVLFPSMPGLGPTTVGGGRFLATTPVWFPHAGPVVPWNDHAPSGYGLWAPATAAAKTGGKYLFYPFPDCPWLAACPADYALLDRLAPEWGGFQHDLALCAGDPALDALARAQEKVVRVTP